MSGHFLGVGVVGLAVAGEGIWGQGMDQITGLAVSEYFCWVLKADGIQLQSPCSYVSKLP